MKLPRLEELALLPEEAAVQRHFDGRNYRIWRILMLVLLSINLVLLGTYLEQGMTVKASLAGAHLLFLAALWLLRGSAFFARSFRDLLLAFLVVEMALATMAAEPELVIGLCYGIVPALLLALRLRPVEHAVLFSGLGLVGGFSVLQTGGERPASVLVGQVFALALPPAAYLVAALLLTRRTRREFVGRWREAGTRERDRLRMRDELADARKIQLSMLPETAPSLPWLELSGSSLPATEVGGDFYDYLELPGGRLAVVVGDVAGHGVSSGLVLAILKGGLHLLRDELDSPAAVCRRLDRMILETVRWRVIVTLLVAVFDPVRRRLTVVSAGHPPALYLSAGGVPRSVGHGAPPLGTRLPNGFSEDVVEIGEGDVVLLYSDGATELGDLAGNLYGSERLHRALRRAHASHGASARTVREALLDDFSRFKTDAPQRDDITLVVARVGAVGG